MASEEQGCWECFKVLRLFVRRFWSSWNPDKSLALLLFSPTTSADLLQETDLPVLFFGWSYDLGKWRTTFRLFPNPHGLVPRKEWGRPFQFLSPIHALFILIDSVFLLVVTDGSRFSLNWLLILAQYTASECGLSPIVRTYTEPATYKHLAITRKLINDEWAIWEYIKHHPETFN